MKGCSTFFAVAASSVLTVAVVWAPWGGRTDAHIGGSMELHPRSLAAVRGSAPVVGVDSVRPTVAVVLGDGGLRVFAHIDVLRALEEAGIKPSMVVGTQADAVVGTVYASGMMPEQIAATARTVEMSSLVD